MRAITFLLILCIMACGSKEQTDVDLQPEVKEEGSGESSQKASPPNPQPEYVGTASIALEVSAVTMGPTLGACGCNEEENEVEDE